MMMITKGVIILHHKSFILAKIILNSSQYISGEKRRVFGVIGSPRKSPSLGSPGGRTGEESNLSLGGSLPRGRAGGGAGRLPGPLCSGGHPRAASRTTARRGRRERAGLSFRLVHHRLPLGLISKQPVLSFPPNVHLMVPIGDMGWSSLLADATSGEGLARPARLGGSGKQGLTQNEPIKPLVLTTQRGGHVWRVAHIPKGFGELLTPLRGAG